MPAGDDRRGRVAATPDIQTEKDRQARGLAVFNRGCSVRPRNGLVGVSIKDNPDPVACYAGP